MHVPRSFRSAFLFRCLPVLAGILVALIDPAVAASAPAAATARTARTVAVGIAAESVPLQTEPVSFDSPRWRFEGQAHRVESYLGRPALYLENAVAALDDVDFREGVIEFDVAFADSRGFCGVEFHRRGGGDHEHFYLRPHQSGFPDASQYQPVFGDWDAWQIYTGPGFSTALDLRFDAWQHVRVVVSGGQADIYVDSDEPVLFVEELLRRDPGGGLALMASFAPARFSNFRFAAAAGLPLRGSPGDREPPAEGLVRTWNVSSTFEEERLAGVLDLSDLAVEGRTWTSIPVEVMGIANLARALPTGDGNTVLASVTIHSDRDRVVLMDFGFSDRVHVFVNGALVYAGSDGYRTRDHRFLGTVGLFDALPLSLRAGSNDVTFAVSEDFGGFAVVARLRSLDGLRIEP
ncbi:MAG: hypothetical protein DHS20C21_20420 [Gemmatimonadota bacterium]|nr:MAG: hypothetical protein DHS20C21_20420 [Gemmatimonadota bacterium]